jgi:hypothetical protein
MLCAEFLGVVNDGDSRRNGPVAVGLKCPWMAQFAPAARLPEYRISRISAFNFFGISAGIFG